jgi:hypothetical protein
MTMVYGWQVPLLGREREHHILVGASDSSFGVGHHSHVQLGVYCTLLVVPWRCATAAPGLVRMPTSEVARTSYRFRCGSVFRSLGHTVLSLRFALTFLFLVCIFCTKCILLTFCNFIFRIGHLRMMNHSP